MESHELSIRPSAAFYKGMEILPASAVGGRVIIREEIFYFGLFTPPSHSSSVSRTVLSESSIALVIPFFKSSLACL